MSRLELALVGVVGVVGEKAERAARELLEWLRSGEAQIDDETREGVAKVVENLMRRVMELTQIAEKGQEEEDWEEVPESGEGEE